MRVGGRGRCGGKQPSQERLQGAEESGERARRALEGSAYNTHTQHTHKKGGERSDCNTQVWRAPAREGARRRRKNNVLGAVRGWERRRRNAQSSRVAVTAAALRSSSSRRASSERGLLLLRVRCAPNGCAHVHVRARWGKWNARGVWGERPLAQRATSWQCAQTLSLPNAASALATSLPPPPLSLGSLSHVLGAVRFLAATKTKRMKSCVRAK